VVKVMGDGVLLAFPTDRARDAVAALRAAQTRATTRWRAFDDRCRVVVKMGAGKVLSGRLGAPGDERPDIYGDTLNRLYKAPAGEFVLMPEVDVLLR
jgi:class 3 adenylate cyclase